MSDPSFANLRLSHGSANREVLGNVDMLGLILIAVGNSDAESACKAATTWCSLSLTHRSMCQTAKLWKSLSGRVFKGAETLDPNNAKINFILQCGRMEEYSFGQRTLQSRTSDSMVEAYVLAAMRFLSSDLYYADDMLKNDVVFMKKAMNINGEALFYANSVLQNTHGVVLVAVRTCGISIKWASLRLRKDEQIVLAAVKSDGASLRYADSMYRKDKNIVKIAVSSTATKAAAVRIPAVVVPVSAVAATAAAPHPAAAAPRAPLNLLLLDACPGGENGGIALLPRRPAERALLRLAVALQVGVLDPEADVLGPVAARVGLADALLLARHRARELLRLRLLEHLVVVAAEALGRDERLLPHR